MEELQNDVKTKQCFVTITDIESFALVLSTISRSLVDLKGKESIHVKSFILLSNRFISFSLRKIFFIGSTINEEVSE